MLLSGNVKQNLQDEYISKNMEKNFISNTLQNPLYVYGNASFGRSLRYFKIPANVLLRWNATTVGKAKVLRKGK